MFFPRISSPFCFVAFLGFPLLSTNQAKQYVFAGVLIPAKFLTQTVPFQRKFAEKQD